MIPDKKDYTLLLNGLNLMAVNYHINDKGTVVDLNDEVVKDEYAILDTKFCTFYCMGYKNFIELIDGCHIDSINENIIKRALSDNQAFCLFIHNCICEYKMYNDVGTGYISYFPYKPVADFFFGNNDRKALLIKYVQNVLDNIVNKEARKGVKK